MADFNSGLPPNGTDISGNSINSISIVAAELIESEVERVTGTLVTTTELIESEAGRVTGVSVDRKPTGKSLIFYL